MEFNNQTKYEHLFDTEIDYFHFSSQFLPFPMKLKFHANSSDDLEKSRITIPCKRSLPLRCSNV